MNNQDTDRLFQPCDLPLVERLIVFENCINNLEAKTDQISTPESAGLLETRNEFTSFSRQMIFEFYFEMIHQDFQLPCVLYLKQFYSQKEIKAKIEDDFVCADNPDDSISISPELKRYLDNLVDYRGAK